MTEQFEDREKRIAAFIVGMARGGTTWMARSLNAHPRMAVIGESLFWGREYEEPGPTAAYSAQDAARIAKSCAERSLEIALSGRTETDRLAIRNALFRELDNIFHSKAPSRSPKTVFTIVATTIADLAGKELVAEKTPHHLLWIDRIAEAYPDARFIVMLRDPYGFMLSYKHFGDQFEGRLRLRLKAQYHPLGCAIVWRGYIKASRQVLSRTDIQALRVEYADLSADPTSALNTVQAFLGLERHPGVSESMRYSSFSRGPAPDLGNADIFWMNLLAGADIRQAGYETRRASILSIAVLISLLRLPFWGLLTLAVKLRTVDGSLYEYFKRWIRPKSGTRPP